MVTKFHIYLSILLPLLLNACGILTVHGSGNIATETRDVHDFDRAVISGTSKLLLTQGEGESLTITADDNLMSYIESEVRDGTLFLGNKEGILPSQPIRFKLNVKEIVMLDISGIVNVETGDIATQQLDIHVSGTSTLHMSKLETQELVINLNGSTKVELMDSGEAIDQKIVLSGSNTYSAPKLRSQSVDVTISGSNDAIVWATDFLNIEASGIGNVGYYGNPQVTQTGSGNTHINGLGNP